MALADATRLLVAPPWPDPDAQTSAAGGNFNGSAVPAQPGVAAPIASARDPGQLAEILPGATLELTDAELSELSNLSAAAPTA